MASKNKNYPNIYKARVVDNNDPEFAQRVKVAIEGQTPSTEWAFSLMPKVFSIVPQIGEMVLIITEEANEANSQRYYIGPIIPQYNNLKRAEYHISTSMLKGGVGGELTIKDIPTSQGAFAQENDVAIYGRGKSDIILGDNDLIIRCAARVEDDNPEHGNPSDKPIAFNTSNPAYIKMNYVTNLSEEWNTQSNVVVVADNINLVSNEDADKYGKNIVTADKDNRMISEADIDDLRNRLHEVPYGDVLVELLDLMRSAILGHVHPYPGTVAIGTMLPALIGYDINSINSQHIKIS